MQHKVYIERLVKEHYTVWVEGDFDTEFELLDYVQLDYEIPDWKQPDDTNLISEYTEVLLFRPSEQLSLPFGAKND